MISRHLHKIYIQMTDKLDNNNKSTTVIDIAVPTNRRINITELETAGCERSWKGYRQLDCYGYSILVVAGILGVVIPQYFQWQLSVRTYQFNKVGYRSFLYWRLELRLSQAPRVWPVTVKRARAAPLDQCKRRKCNFHQ